MQALVLPGVSQSLQLEERPDLEPTAGLAIVAIVAAALNRRDYWITQGKYPGMQFPAVLGSDGAGIVRSVGSASDAPWVGQEVILNPGLDWGDNQQAQGPQFRILGMPDHGTFATHVRVATSQLVPRPSHLTWEQAAALPLAGLTAYRALFTQGMLKVGQRVLITGGAGGVATLAIQFAAAAGAHVCCTSSSAEKRTHAMALGAIGTYDYNDPEWTRQLRAQHGAMHLIVDGAGGENFGTLVDALESGGRIVIYGSTAGPAKSLDLFKIFWRQLQVVGSTMGSPRDFADMIRFVDRHAVVPTVDEIFPLAQGNEALAKLARFGHFGKIVLRIREPL